jgi:hypothetical protein
MFNAQMSKLQQILFYTIAIALLAAYFSNCQDKLIAQLQELTDGKDFRTQWSTTSGATGKNTVWC